MTIKYHKRFTKSYKKLSSRVKKKLKERLLLFEQDQFSPILNNHHLKGKYKGFRSINVTGDLRAIYRRESRNTITFVAIDNHSNLYG